MSGVFALVNEATGLALDSNGEGHVYALHENGGAYQKWDIQQHGGWAYLINQATGLVMDSNHEGNAYALHANGGNYQHWRV